MQVKLTHGQCVVTREKGDKPINKPGYGFSTGYENTKVPADPASTLVYRVRKILNARGYRLAKMRGDGGRHYMQSPKHGWKYPDITIYYSGTSKQLLRDYNRGKKAVFGVLYNIFDKQPKCEEMVERLEVLAAAAEQAAGCGEPGLFTIASEEDAA